MAKCLTEFIGTYFLVLLIGLSVHSANPAFAPLAIGLGLAALVYMGAHISGAHYNPAVTIALLARGAIGVIETLLFIVVQFLGAIAATWSVNLIANVNFALAPLPEAKMPKLLFVEFLFTFLLMLVILNVAVSEKTRRNSYYGLAIGLTVTAGAYAVGGISGAAFNPAVGVGPLLYRVFAGAAFAPYWWLYVVAPIAGALAADLVFFVQEGSMIPRDKFTADREPQPAPTD